MAHASFGDWIWAVVVIGGFIVLGGAIAYAKLRNRTTPQQDRQTERATHELYEKQSAEDAPRTP